MLVLQHALLMLCTLRLSRALPIGGQRGTHTTPQLTLVPMLHFITLLLQMMLTSTPIKDSEALKLGLLDAVVPAGELLQAAKQHALDIAEGRKPRVLSLSRTGMVRCGAFS
jgi:enoyl-CoA hydratase/carnithine racemase